MRTLAGSVDGKATFCSRSSLFCALSVRPTTARIGGALGKEKLRISFDFKTVQPRLKSLPVLLRIGSNLSLQFQSPLSFSASRSLPFSIRKLGLQNRTLQLPNFFANPKSMQMFACSNVATRLLTCLNLELDDICKWPSKNHTLTPVSRYGGFSKFPHDLPELYYSYYGFSAFSLLEEADLNLNPLFVQLGITRRAATGM